MHLGCDTGDCHTRGRWSARTMAPLIDIVGQSFGRLTVVGFVRTNEHGKSFWKCRCACGDIAVVAKAQLRDGNTRSCGCLRKETSPGNSTKTHGMSKTLTYRSWAMMHARCAATNPNDRRYRYYAGRGIKVCRRWFSFENFFADMGKRPSRRHSLDRFPDNDGNYRPGNVRWATQRQQLANRRPTQKGK